ncbi:MAG: tyrosine-type recombinase/integrase [Nannocystales bacterium]
MSAENTLAVMAPAASAVTYADADAVRESLQNAIKAWLSGKSEHTVRARLSDLRLFATFVRGEVISDPVDGTLVLIEGGQLVAESSIADWWTEMVERELQPTSIARRIASLRSLTATLRRFGLTWDLTAVRGPSYRPYDRAEGPDVQDLEAKIDELERLADGDDDKSKTLIHARDYAMFVTLYHTAMRRESLVTMLWSETHLDATRPHARAIVKGGSTRRFPLSPQAVSALQRWQQLRVLHLGHIASDATVFCGTSGRGKGGSLHPDSVYKRTKYVHGLSGPHGFRHTAATVVFEESNGNLKQACDLLGHSNPATTRSYFDKQGHSAEEATMLIANRKRSS